MYTYTVYLIPGKKIGCTTDFKRRMSVQRFTNSEILWQEEGDYEFGWDAGDKEIELQLQYFGNRDNGNHYQESRINRVQTFEVCSKGGKKGGAIQGRNLVESGKWDEYRNKGQNVRLEIIQCPHCPIFGARFNLTRYHFDKCKHKDIKKATIK